MSHSFMTIQPMKDAIAAQTRRFAREEDGNDGMGAFRDSMMVTS